MPRVEGGRVQKERPVEKIDELLKAGSRVSDREKSKEYPISFTSNF